MVKLMRTTAYITGAATVVLVALYKTYGTGLLFSLAITFGTTAYHFIMRLAVGGVVKAVMHNRADYYRKWFRPRRFEASLYRFLKVKKWKNRMPTYEPETFSLHKHNFDEIAQTMCQSEIVHELIAVLSFLPLFTVPWFGSFPVFLLTSTAAACFDLSFAMMQRYNRPRVIRLAEKKGQSSPL